MTTFHLHRARSPSGFVALAVALVGCSADLASSVPVEHATFVQADLDAVDVLWVVDDSSTFMESVQHEVAAATPALAEPLGGLDVQMAVITTTLGAPLDPFDGDVDQLAERLVVGAEGSDKERGLQAAAAALDGDPGFVRPHAHLVMVFVSDEDDCSDQGRLAGEPGAACYTAGHLLDPVEDYVELFEGLHDGALNRTTAVSMGTGPTSGCPDTLPPVRYAQVAQATGGPQLDLCATDHEPQLALVGELAAGLRRGFRLPGPAVARSLSVEVDGQPVEAFAYDPSAWIVRFDDAAVPSAGSIIDLRYEPDPWGTDP